MTKAIYFDMDGTIANLYGRENWLPDLRAEVDGVYDKLEPMVDLDQLQEVCMALVAQGWKLGIITWLGMGASDEYEERSTQEKKLWRDNNTPYLQEFYAQRYGTPKQYAPARRSSKMILVDDNAEVRAMWDTEKQRQSIDAKGDMIAALWELVED